MSATEFPVQMLGKKTGVPKGTPSPKKGVGVFGKQVLIRLPVDAIAKLDAAAKAQHRSRTAEIWSRLEASLEGESIDEHAVIVTRSAPAAK